MNRAIFDKIRPFVTIYGPGGVNINTASREALVAVGIADTLAAKVLAYRAGSDSIPGTPDDLAFTTPDAIPTEIARLVPIDGEEATVLTNLASNGTLRTSSTLFEVISRARLDTGRAEMEIRAVIDRHGKIYSYRTSKVQWLQTSAS
jgi:type II secretory pathway component PulK